MPKESDTDTGVVVKRNGIVLDKSVIAIILALVGGTAGASALITIPYRVEQTEKKLYTMQEERQTDHEALVRIEANIKNLRNELRWHLNNRYTPFGATNRTLPMFGNDEE